MSDNWVILIPTDPEFVPDVLARRQACEELTRRLPAAYRIDDDLTDDVRFIHQGANFESVSCPSCGEELTLEWWQGAMNAAHAGHFRDLRATPPCCNVPTSLNDLRYDWPAGFARFEIDIKGGVEGVEASDMSVVEGILGCKLRLVWRHL